jgi:hypothetical protein
VTTLPHLTVTLKSHQLLLPFSSKAGREDLSPVCSWSVVCRWPRCGLTQQAVDQAEYLRCAYCRVALSSLTEDERCPLCSGPLFWLAGIMPQHVFHWSFPSLYCYKSSICGPIWLKRCTETFDYNFKWAILSDFTLLDIDSPLTDYKLPS